MSRNGAIGVRIAGTGSAVPQRVLTNADFERIVNTTDEWIQQRTGIRERRICDPETDSNFSLAALAMERALEAAKMDGKQLDLVVCASCTQEMTCPSNACRIAARVGATPAPAFDLVAACSGFVYGLNVVDSLIRTGRYRTIGLVGCDVMSSVIDYTDRGASILFGDAAGAAVFVADEDPNRGCIFQELGADGTDWSTLYIPRRQKEIAAAGTEGVVRLNCLHMDGREVFKFAVTKFREVIEHAMKSTGLKVDDVGQVICHQSNARIIEAAREKIGFSHAQVYVNIDRYGNSSAGSVGLCLDELWRNGTLPSKKPSIFVAFGGGLTWGSSVWRF